MDAHPRRAPYDHCVTGPLSKIKRTAFLRLFLMRCDYLLAFFAAGFLAGAAFLAAGFAAVFLAGAFAAGFLVTAAGLTPASLATLDSCALRRAAVFFGRTFFLTAVSSSDWAALRPAAVGLAKKALTALFRLRFVVTLRARRFAVWRIRLMADLMIGMECF